MSSSVKEKTAGDGDPGSLEQDSCTAVEERSGKNEEMTESSVESDHPDGILNGEVKQEENTEEVDQQEELEDDSEDWPICVITSTSSVKNDQEDGSNDKKVSTTDVVDRSRELSTSSSVITEQPSNSTTEKESTPKVKKMIASGNASTEKIHSTDDLGIIPSSTSTSSTKECGDAAAATTTTTTAEDLQNNRLNNKSTDATDLLLENRKEEPKDSNKAMPEESIKIDDSFQFKSPIPKISTKLPPKPDPLPPLLLYACPKCDLEFETRPLLNTHLSESHPLPPKSPPPKTSTQLPTQPAVLYACPKCDLEFESRPLLNTHLSESHPLPPKPPVSPTTKTTVEPRRLSKDSIGPPYECPQCDRRFPLPYHLKKHMIIHNKPHQCPSCSQSFIKIEGLNLHKRLIHDVAGLSTFKCLFCGKQDFLLLSDLYTHRVENHPEIPFQGDTEKAFGCGICQKPYLRKGDALVCAMLGHDPTSLHDAMFQYKCPECPENALGYRLLSHLKLHWDEEHANDKTFPEEEITPSENGYSHIAPSILPVVLIDKREAYDLKEKGLPEGEDLNKLILHFPDISSIKKKGHCVIPVFPCPDCPLTFIDVDSLRIHEQVHLQEDGPPLPSPIRKRGRPSSKSLTCYSSPATATTDHPPPEPISLLPPPGGNRGNHLIPKFRCLVCGQKFRKLKRLREHEQVHLMEDPNAPVFPKLPGRGGRKPGGGLSSAKKLMQKKIAHAGGIVRNRGRPKKSYPFWSPMSSPQKNSDSMENSSDDESNRSFQCKLCPASYSIAKGLRKHELTAHNAPHRKPGRKRKSMDSPLPNGTDSESPEDDNETINQPTEHDHVVASSSSSEKVAPSQVSPSLPRGRIRVGRLEISTKLNKMIKKNTPIKISVTDENNQIAVHFQCPKCPKVFKDRRGIHLHILGHTLKKGDTSNDSNSGGVDDRDEEYTGGPGNQGNQPPPSSISGGKRRTSDRERRAPKKLSEYQVIEEEEDGSAPHLQTNNSVATPSDSEEEEEEEAMALSPAPKTKTEVRGRTCNNPLPPEYFGHQMVEEDGKEKKAPNKTDRDAQSQQAVTSFQKIGGDIVAAASLRKSNWPGRPKSKPPRPDYYGNNAESDKNKVPTGNAVGGVTDSKKASYHTCKICAKTFGNATALRIHGNEEHKPSQAAKQVPKAATESNTEDDKKNDETLESSSSSSSTSSDISEGSVTSPKKEVKTYRAQKPAFLSLLQKRREEGGTPLKTTVSPAAVETTSRVSSSPPPSTPTPHVGERNETTPPSVVEAQLKEEEEMKQQEARKKVSVVKLDIPACTVKSQVPASATKPPVTAPLAVKSKTDAPIPMKKQKLDVLAPVGKSRVAIASPSSTPEVTKSGPVAVEKSKQEVTKSAATLKPQLSATVVKLKAQPEVTVPPSTSQRPETPVAVAKPKPEVTAPVSTPKQAAPISVVKSKQEVTGSGATGKPQVSAPIVKSKPEQASGSTSLKTEIPVAASVKSKSEATRLTATPKAQFTTMPVVKSNAEIIVSTPTSKPQVSTPVVKSKLEVARYSLPSKLEASTPFIKRKPEVTRSSLPAMPEASAPIAKSRQEVLGSGAPPPKPQVSAPVVKSKVEVTRLSLPSKLEVSTPVAKPRYSLPTKHEVCAPGVKSKPEVPRATVAPKPQVSTSLAKFKPEIFTAASSQNSEVVKPKSEVIRFFSSQKPKVSTPVLKPNPQVMGSAATSKPALSVSVVKSKPEITKGSTQKSVVPVAAVKSKIHVPIRDAKSNTDSAVPVLTPKPQSPIKGTRFKPGFAIPVLKPKPKPLVPSSPATQSSKPGLVIPDLRPKPMTPAPLLKPRPSSDLGSKSNHEMSPPPTAKPKVLLAPTKKLMPGLMPLAPEPKHPAEKTKLEVPSSVAKLHPEVTVSVVKSKQGFPVSRVEPKPQVTISVVKSFPETPIFGAGPKHEIPPSGSKEASKKELEPKQQGTSITTKPVTTAAIPVEVKRSTTPTVPATTNSATTPTVPVATKPTAAPAVRVATKPPRTPVDPVAIKPTGTPPAPVVTKSTTTRAIPVTIKSTATPTVPVVIKSTATPDVPVMIKSTATPAVPLAPKTITTPVVPVVIKSTATPEVPVIIKSTATPAIPLAPKTITTPVVPVTTTTPVVPVTTTTPVVPVTTTTPVAPVATKPTTTPVAPVAIKSTTTPIAPVTIKPSTTPVVIKPTTTPVVTKSTTTPAIPVTIKSTATPLVMAAIKSTMTPAATDTKPTTTSGVPVVKTNVPTPATSVVIKSTPTSATTVAAISTSTPAVPIACKSITTPDVPNVTKTSTTAGVPSATSEKESPPVSNDVSNNVVFKRKGRPPKRKLWGGKISALNGVPGTKSGTVARIGQLKIPPKFRDKEALKADKPIIEIRNLEDGSIQKVYRCAHCPKTFRDLRGFPFHMLCHRVRTDRKVSSSPPSRGPVASKNTDDLLEMRNDQKIPVAAATGSQQGGGCGEVAKKTDYRGRGRPRKYPKIPEPQDAQPMLTSATTQATKKNVEESVNKSENQIVQQSQSSPPPSSSSARVMASLPSTKTLSSTENPAQKTSPQPQKDMSSEGAAAADDQITAKPLLSPTSNEFRFKIIKQSVILPFKRRRGRPSAKYLMYMKGMQKGSSSSRYLAAGGSSPKFPSSSTNQERTSQPKENQASKSLAGPTSHKKIDKPSSSSPSSTCTSEQIKNMCASINGEEVDGELDEPMMKNEDANKLKNMEDAQSPSQGPPNKKAKLTRMASVDSISRPRRSVVLEKEKTLQKESTEKAEDTPSGEELNQLEPPPKKLKMEEPQQSTSSLKVNEEIEHSGVASVGGGEKNTPTLASPPPPQDTLKRKRGRPKKIDGVSPIYYTSTIATSTGQRGRPRKSESGPIPTTVTPLASRGRPRKSESTPNSTITPSASRGRPRKSESLPSSTTTPTPTGQRGRPRKSDSVPSSSITPIGPINPPSPSIAKHTLSKEEVENFVKREKQIVIDRPSCTSNASTPPPQLQAVRKKGRPRKIKEEESVAVSAGYPSTSGTVENQEGTPEEKLEVSKNDIESSCSNSTNVAMISPEESAQTPAPPKRKGRPPKKRIESLGESGNGGYQVESSTDETAGPVKTPESVAGKEGPEEENGSGTSGSGGMEMKNVSEMCEEETQFPTVAKRGRGRPRKFPIPSTSTCADGQGEENPDNTNQNSEDAEMRAARASSAEPAEGIKRKRGRPRKSMPILTPY